MLQGLYALITFLHDLRHVADAPAHLPAYGGVGEQRVQRPGAGLHLLLQTCERGGQLPGYGPQLADKSLVRQQITDGATALPNASGKRSAYPAQRRAVGG